jgi:hypothetical protein
VIDNLVADADQLVDMAAEKHYAEVAAYYPGVRAKAPLSYQQFVLRQLQHEFGEFFGLDAGSLHFTGCHFSVVTTPPSRLSHPQRIPHVDSLSGNELAFIHYLFKADHGGTAFYRHRKTGYESVDQERQAAYFAHVSEERSAVERSEPGYIDGNTEFYEQIARQEGVFNRMLVYRRNALHSGSIGPAFNASPDPRQGRLSINGFLK